jgi:CubicO group peptidase (beta-lactamase class C family)
MKPHRFSRSLAAILLMVLAPAAIGAPTADPRNLGRDLDSWARPLVERGLLSGNLLIAHRDSVLLERSWGMADVAKRVPNAPALPSCIASVNKPITVILAIQLIREGKLGISDPLSWWIPDFPHGDSITVEHLLSHASGIPHRVTTDAEERVPQTAASMAAIASRATLLHRPGERRSYSSAGFAVLARVLELAGGADYASLLRQRIVEPLGLTQTFHPDVTAASQPRAVGYVPGVNGPEPDPLRELSFLVGAGSVFSTARDLHRLLWADVSGRLGEDVRQSALRGSKVNWNGFTGGHRAFAEYDTTTGYAVVFTGNLHSGAVDLMKGTIGQLLAGKSPESPVLPPARAAVVAPEVLRSYEGFYDVAGNPRLPVRARNEGLDVDGWTLVALSDSTFFSLRDFATVKVVSRDRRSIDRLDWMQGGQVWPCPRVGSLP